MQAAFDHNKGYYPESWQQLPLGDLMVEQLERAMEEPSRQMFGYHLLKLGNLSSQLSLPHCPIKHQIRLQSTFADNVERPIPAALRARRTALPFQENSVDAVIIANELDFARDPHQILREVERIIMPNGHLILTGFNPFSLAGIARFLPFKHDSALHKARFFSRVRVKDWLQLLGFEVIEQQHLIYSELLFERHLNESRQQFAKRYFRTSSAVYMLVARKRVIPLSRIKPRWLPKPRFSVVNISASRSYKDLL